MEKRDELNRFIASLPDGLLGEVLDFAQFVARKTEIEQFSRVRAAMEVLPEDAEILTDAELQVVSDAEQSVNVRGTVTLEELKSQYGP